MVESSDEATKRSTTSSERCTGKRRDSRTRRAKSGDGPQRGDRPSSSTSMNTCNHEKRLQDLRTRKGNFKVKSTELATFLQSHQPTMVSSESALEMQHGYKVLDTEPYFTYSIISQSNLAGFSQLNKAVCSTDSSGESARLFVRVIKMGRLAGEVALRLNKSLAISKYFGDKHSSHFLKIHAIFCVSYTKILVFHERFKLENSLLHKAFGEEVTVPLVKEWVCQLATAVEYLNLHGVAHRFIRAENVLLSSGNSIKLTSFDMACVYWDPEQSSLVPSPKKALPIDGIPSHLLNHLPPEAFEENYDSSMVDVWSIGVLLCNLLARESPFVVTSSGEPNTMICGVSTNQWKTFKMKLLIPCELRSLLNDIFVDANVRMTTFDLDKDKRLSPEMTSDEFNRSRPKAYYRIDLAKNINVDMPAQRSSSIDLHKTRTMPADLFAPEANAVLKVNSFEKVANESAITKYKIHRDASFTADLSAKLMGSDQYLRASKQPDEAKTEQQPTEVLVKIIQASTVPVRYYSQILGESSHIIRYFSAAGSIERYLHRVLDIYRDQCRIYIFCDALTGHQTLQAKVRNDLPLRELPPLASTADGPQHLNQENVLKWTKQLAGTVAHLANYGISHRYIRPEFVFIAPNGDIKLSHFDLACFAWHPSKHHVVPRSYGLQDELEQQWNHLPPECFEPNYESLLLDVWSVAVLFLFSLTGEWPFVVPLSVEAAAEQWAQWKLSEKGRQVAQSFEQQVTGLDQVFVPFNRRIDAQSLLKTLDGKLNDAPNDKVTRLPATGSGLSTPKERTSSHPKSTDRKTTRGSSSATNVKNDRRPRGNRKDSKEKKDKKNK